MQVLIIEDEMRAANQLQKLLRQSEFDHQLMGVLDTVEESVQWFRTNTKPDLVFMDIQLADGLSFEIFQQIELRCPIIFTTAFDQYAIRAFKVNSIDYLLKPIQLVDLKHALEKFKRSEQPFTLNEATLKDFLEELQLKESRQGVLVKEGDDYFQLKISELLYAYSEDSVTFGVTESKRVIIDETLDQLFATLDPTKFFKINRGQVIAKQAIIKISKYFNHRLKLNITQARAHEFIVSRQKVNDFKTWLNS